MTAPGHPLHVRGQAQVNPRLQALLDPEASRAGTKQASGTGCFKITARYFMLRGLRIEQSFYNTVEF